MSDLKQTSVLFDISKIKPLVSIDAFDMHYNGVYKKHIDDYNAGLGDYAFNKAGAFLHSLYFENIREWRQDNLPTGKVLQVIEMRYGSYNNFLTMLQEQVDRLQGNGWVFMNTSGYVNIIPNNRIVDNIGFVIDMWEHAYIPTHGLDRNKYLKLSLQCINWEVVNNRILNPFKEK